MLGLLEVWSRIILFIGFKIHILWLSACNLLSSERSDFKFSVIFCTVELLLFTNFLSRFLHLCQILSLTKIVFWAFEILFLSPWMRICKWYIDDCSYSLILLILVLLTLHFPLTSALYNECKNFGKLFEELYTKRSLLFKVTPIG